MSIIGQSRKIFHVYIDESRIKGDRYMVIGGIIVSDRNLHQVDGHFQQFRDSLNLNKELKWSKISRSFYPYYFEYVSKFFICRNYNLAHFRSMIIDTHKVNHAKYSDGKKEDTFYKFVYQLICHCHFQSVSPFDSKLIIHLDQRDSSYSLEDLLRILNRGINKRYNRILNPIISVEGMDSKKSNILQVNDILIGAIGYDKNGYYYMGGSSPVKCGMVQHIRDKAGLKNLCDTTPKGQKSFTIWNFNLR